MIQRRFVYRSFAEEIFYTVCASFNIIPEDSVTRFSTISIVRQTIPKAPLVHRLEPFRIWIRICEDILLQKLTTLRFSLTIFLLTNCRYIRIWMIFVRLLL
jgi:hypothetical protein